MMKTADGGSHLHALLIGVDHYLPHTLPDGSSYGDLTGCCWDVQRVAVLLQTRFRVPDTQIRRLTSCHTEAIGVSDDPATAPTYRNMVAAFQAVAAGARAGDQIYIHYSGHGGRAATLFPQLKGADAIDEGLVPMDIGDPNARYLRDLELHYLLQDMVAKGLIVTLVLDCCHSGGIAHASHVKNRGIFAIDDTPRPSESLVASRQELVERWTPPPEGPITG